jgi:histone H3/H4
MLVFGVRKFTCTSHNTIGSQEENAMSATTDSGTGKGKKRKASDGGEKFQSIVKAFSENQESFFNEWMASNGIPEAEPVKGAEGLTPQERGTFADEMVGLFDAYVYDTILHLESGKDGMCVPTLKSGEDPNKQSTFYEEISRGPDHFVSANPSPSEGEEEGEMKKKARKLHGYNKADLSRSCNIGGAVRASPEAKELLGCLLNMRRAHLIQRSMLAATSDKKRTVKAKHVKTAIATEGITAV